MIVQMQMKYLRTEHRFDTFLLMYVNKLLYQFVTTKVQLLKIHISELITEM
jgi:hypothetical protein